MSRWLSALLVVIIACLPVKAQSEQSCQNSFEPGQPIDGRFMAIPYLIVGHILAEKYCGADSKPIKKKILGTVEELGCGPGTDIYREIENSLSKLQNFDLKHLADDGNPDSKLSPAQVKE